MIDNRVAADLDRMLRAAKDAVNFTADASETQFMANRMMQAATVMCLAIVGEAASRIVTTAPEFAADHTDWPWTAMRGLRNRAAHDYDTIDFQIVWRTVKASLPDLIAAIDALGPLTPSGHSGS